MYIFRKPRLGCPAPNSFLGEDSLTTKAQRCQQLEKEVKTHKQTVDALKCELQIPFTDPNDPRLYLRRLRLRNLFKAIPAAQAKLLYDQLRQKNDALAELFRYRLSTPPHNELLEILRVQSASPAASPPKQPSAPVWSTDPLPRSELHRFETAIKDLENRVLTTQDPRMWRYLCWIEKLKKLDVDDRFIRWGKICPIFGAMGAALLVGPCDLTQGTPVDQAELQRSIKSMNDVEIANRSLHFIAYMRSSIVVSFEMTSLPLENLRIEHDDMGRAIDKLDIWANNPMGGSSGMPLAYRAIKDWIKMRQRDPKSIYSCH